MTDQQDPDPIDFQNLSIVAINHEILRRIAELKHFSAAELGLDDPPLSLLMLECMYELKMSSLRIRTEEEIRKFDSYSDRQLVKVWPKFLDFYNKTFFKTFITIKESCKNRETGFSNELQVTKPTQKLLSS